jgi:hypothetical protein
MTDDVHWYVLDFNEGGWVTIGGGAVEASSFEEALSTRDGEAEFSLRLWRAPDHPDLMPEADQNTARENCLLAVGSADELAVEWRAGGTRYQVGRPESETPARSIRFNLGHEVTVHGNEIHDTREAGRLFYSFFQRGTVTTGDYQLRELRSPDVLAADAATLALTINYDEHRPVLPTVAASEFAAFLNHTNDDDPSVLVLWPLPQGKTVAELTAEELSTQPEFLQTAGSSGRYTVELRQRAGATHKLYTVGRQVDDVVVWDTELTEIAIGSQVVRVYPNEVFSSAEVGTLFQHYTQHGHIPGEGYLLGEIPLV